MAISLSGGEGIVEGTQLPVANAMDGSCLPNNSMIVEWTTTNLTLRRQLNTDEITCTASNPSGIPTSLSTSTEIDVQCELVNVIVYGNIMLFMDSCCLVNFIELYLIMTNN